MSYSSINDPSAVAALLDQLKASAAWQELEATAAATEAPGESTPSAEAAVDESLPASTSSASTNNAAGPSNAQTAPTETSSGDVDETTASRVTDVPPTIIAGTSVASLLSQLQPFNGGAPTDSYLPSDTAEYGFAHYQNGGELPYPPPPPLPASRYVSGAAVPPASFTEDRKTLSFRESLPIISDLANEPSFVEKIRKLKDDQNELERSLWADREQIYTKYNDKLKVARTKAQVIGTTVSQHEITMITDAYTKELSRFDRERVLPAWDGLVTRQQNDLLQLNVPSMFVTNETDDREKQQQVVNLIETLVGPKSR